MTALKFFIFGLLAAAGALVGELVLVTLASVLFNIDLTANYFDAVTALLILAIAIEEVFKLILLRQLFIITKKTTARISLALLFGSGFAFLEIFSKLTALPQPTLLAIFSWNFFGVFLIHVLTAGVLGGFLTAKKGFSVSYALLAFLFASFLHLGYNLLIIYNQGAIFISIYLLGITTGFYWLQINLQDKKNSTIIEARH